MTKTNMTQTEKQGRGRPAKLIVDEKFIKLYNSMSNTEIAEHYNVTVSAVQKAARKVDLRKNSGGRPGKMPSVDEFNALRERYTDAEIATMFKVCVGTVIYWKKKAVQAEHAKNDMKLAG